VHDITEFLRRHEPFDELDEETLERIGASTEVEYFPARTMIFAQTASPLEHVRMIRRGAVELLDDGEVLDELGEGDLFGHPSMLTGLPTEFGARACEDTLCYRMRASDITPLLARPEGMRFVARAMRHREALRTRVSETAATRLAARRAVQLLRTRYVECAPETSIGEAAQAMVAADVSCAVVRLGEGHGIITDRDLRARVVAVGRSLDAPVRDVMSAPVLSVDPECPSSEVALAMLEHGVRHVPVIDAAGNVLGVVRDVDLLAADATHPFTLSREIRRAATVADLRQVATGLPGVLIGLADSRMPGASISRIHATIADAIVARLVELIMRDERPLNFSPTWVALGSHGRRELVPASDLDSAFTWPAYATPDDETLVRRIATSAVEALAELPGLSPDANGETAASPLFARSQESWRQLVGRWARTPSVDKVPIVLSAVLDGRALGGATWSETVLGEMNTTLARDELARWLLRLALGHKLPAASVRTRMLDAVGGRGEVDLKGDAVQPIVNIARYGGFMAGGGLVSTQARLLAAGDAGIFSQGDAELLAEAHEWFTDLRIARQLEQLRDGIAISDLVPAGELTTLARAYMKDAFRLIGGIRRRLTDQLRVP
jgi:CBS domain-containing protein